MLVRGAEPMEKRQRRILLQPFLISAPSLYLTIREQVTPAAVSRQERSDRVSEEASFHRDLHFALTHRCCISRYPMKHFRKPLLRCNILSQYTLR
jgi:hypothetical protein